MAKKDRLYNIVKYLSSEGQRIVATQLNKVDYTHRTHNLNDSYGYGVYVNKELVAKGFSSHKAKAGKMFENEIISGRKAITDFLEAKYVPHDGIDLVIVAAMPYGAILQEGQFTRHTDDKEIIVKLKKKYEVIAIAQNQLKALGRRFKGSTSGIIKNGKY